MKQLTFENILEDMGNLKQKVWGLNLIFDLLEALKITGDTEKLEQLQAKMESEGINFEQSN